MDFNEETRGLLENEIQRRIENLKNSPSSDDDEKDVTSLTKLYQLKIDEEKIEEDSDKETARYLLEEKCKDKELEQKDEELRQKNQELEDQKLNQKIGFGVAGFMIISDLLLKLIGYGYEYNQSGMITSQTFRKVLGSSPDLSKLFNFSTKKKK